LLQVFGQTLKLQSKYVQPGAQWQTPSTQAPFPEHEFGHSQASSDFKADEVAIKSTAKVAIIKSVFILYD
jgi:hypothetical protein